MTSNLSKISTFISIPGLIIQNQLCKKNSSSKDVRCYSKKKKILCQNSSEKTKNQKEWLDSVLSVREQSDKKYLNKWRKVGVNLIKGLPFPSRSDESWKLTSLKKIYGMRFAQNEEKPDPNIIEEYIKSYTGLKIVFVNGIYSEKLSDISCSKEGIFFGELDNYQEQEIESVLEFLSKGESGINGGFFPILNIACLPEIYVLALPPGIDLEIPVNVIFISSNGNTSSSYNHRLIIIAGEKSKGKIIEHHIGLDNSEYFDNTAISILGKENSMLDFYLVNENSNLSTCIHSIHAEIKDRASLNFSTISLGGSFNRVNLGVDINGTNSYCSIKGASVAYNNQISDFHSRISHNLPNSKSSQLQKILLTDKAHGVFAGKIQVQHGAGNTDSDQLCKTLLLSSSSRIDALPILEINNENVKCTHGSTVSDLDENQMFYLQSRGVPAADAKKLLTIGFINEMIIEYPEELKTKIIKKLGFLM